ncbi:MAG: hypothetical protein JST22_17125 [Bacteroidetes bacterium]|nr:hypothetical protein [Bacteroidota bacterium]
MRVGNSLAVLIMASYIHRELNNLTSQTPSTSMTYSSRFTKRPCGCEGSDVIESWLDLTNMKPRNPLDLIVNAKIGAAQGTFLNSTSYLTSGTWYNSPLIVTGQATCSALGTDNQLLVADADQWNFQHQTVNLSSALPPPLQKLMFLRGGTQWQMSIPINFGGTTFTDIQLSFRDNAATRGDYSGTVPTISWTSVGFAGSTNLQISLSQTGRAAIGIRLIDNSGKYYMHEMEWVIVP